MWLWQRKNTQKRHLLWLKLFSLCLFVHLSYLSWAFFIAHDTSRTVFVSLHKHIDYNAPILFVPITAQQNNTAVMQTDNKSVIATIPSPTAETNKANITKKPAQKATTTIATPTKPAEVKKSAPKELVKTTPVAPVEQVVKQAEIAPVKKTARQEFKSSAPATQAAQNQRIIPENAQVSNDYREVEALRRMALLQKELIHHWKPPIGSPANALCEIACTVDDKGSVTNISIIKSSGIMLYDLSARHAVFSMQMPQWTHNKIVTITFKQ